MQAVLGFEWSSSVRHDASSQDRGGSPGVRAIDAARAWKKERRNGDRSATVT